MYTLQPTCRVGNRAAVVARAQPLKAVQQVAKNVQLPAAFKPAFTVAVANLIAASPVMAAEEAGKLFDFNLTLPIMAGQFLLLMVFLDKTWFTPVGKVLDERDEFIRGKLASVQGDTGKIAEMQAKAEKALKDARDAANAAVNEAKRSTQAEQDAKLDKLRAQVDKELQSALTELETERKNAASSINEQVDNLAEEILMRVLPEGEEPVAA